MAESTKSAADGEAVRDRRRRRRYRSRWWVVALTAAAAVGGATAGAHPTGHAGPDIVYSAAVCALITVAAATASREARLVFAAVVVGASRGLILLPAVATLGAAVSSVWLRRWRQRTGAVVGAVGSQVILRWPHLGFQGLTVLLACVAVTPLLFSAYRQLGRRGRRRTVGVTTGLVALAVLACAPLALGALLARHPVADGISATRSALAQVSDGQASDASATLAVGARRFGVAHRDVGSWWTEAANLVPVAAQQRRALAVATDAAIRVTAAAGREASRVDYGSLHYAGGIDLTQVEAMATPVARLDGDLRAAQGQLHAIRSGWLVRPIQSRLATLGSQLDRAQSNADLAASALRSAPGLLGADGPRRYFVAFMTPAESRGLDGYIGAFGILQADDGHLTLTRSGSIGDLTRAVPSGTRQLHGPADYVARYGGFRPEDSLGDLSYAPDLPTVTNVIGQMVQQSNAGTIDGVLGLDPEGLAAFLRITGPISVPGLPDALTSDNAAQILLKDQYSLLQAGNAGPTTRHDFLQDALSVAFPKLVHGSLPSPRILSADLDPAVRAGHLQLWSTHPAEWPLLDRLGIAGHFPAVGGGDLLAITTDNAANNKTDAYLQRTIDDRVSYDPGTGAVTSHVTLTLRNDTPTASLPTDVTGSYAGSGLAPGTDRSWVTLYSPLTVTSEAVDGQATLPTTGPELGVRASSSYANVPAGGSTTITYVLQGHVRPGTDYHLVARLQPMGNPDHETIEVKRTGQARIVRACTLTVDLVQSCNASFMNGR